jgi:hypothetical protein
MKLMKGWRLTSTKKSLLGRNRRAERDAPRATAHTPRSTGTAHRATGERRVEGPTPHRFQQAADMSLPVAQAAVSAVGASTGAGQWKRQVELMTQVL